MQTANFLAHIIKPNHICFMQFVCKQIYLSTCDVLYSTITLVCASEREREREGDGHAKVDRYTRTLFFLISGGEFDRL